MDFNSSIKTSNEKPPVYEACVKQFNINWNDGIIFAYGDTIYSKHPVSASKIVHESVHLKQQEDWGVEVWWDKYLKDKDFRLQQELEAYKEEIEWLMKFERNRQELERKLRNIIIDLSSSMYGNMITEQEAIKLLRITPSYNEKTTYRVKNKRK